MITYVDSKNAGMYQTRFEQATAVLRENRDLNSNEEITTLEEYFLYLKNLAMIDPYYTMLPVDEETFDINANTRKISIPADFAKNGLGVQGDEIAEVVYFTIDRFFDATDLSDPSMQIAIQWETSDKKQGVSKEFVRDITSYPGKLIFGWPLVSEITKTPGKVKFSVRFYKIGDRTVIASNGAEVTQQYLTYNFNTIPAEITINSSLDYSLYGEEKIDSVDRENLIVNRIVNSVITDPSIPDPSEPVWRINLSPVDLSAYMPAPEDDDATLASKAIERGKYLIKDLVVVQNARYEDGVLVEEPKYGYNMEAYATGDGSISYSWLRADLDANGNVISEESAVPTYNNSTYVKASAGEMDKTKTYYTAIGRYEEVYHEPVYDEDDPTVIVKEAYKEIVVSGISGYQPQQWFAQPGDPTKGAIIDEDGKTTTSTGTVITLYERHSKAVAESAGIYHVTATNRRLGKAKTIDSYTITIPMPRIPVIENEPTENGDTLTENNAIFNRVIDDGEVIHVLLNGSTNSTMLHTTGVSPEIATARENGWTTPEVSLTYEWYSDADKGIFEPSDEGGNINEMYRLSGANEAYYNVLVPNTENYDQYFYAKVFNNRNLEKAFKYSLPYRVTPTPKAPVLIAPTAPNGVRNYTVGTSIEIRLNEDIQHDEWTYQWKRFNPEGNIDEDQSVTYEYGEDDYILSNETSKTFQPTEAGTYYCEITNHLNGSTNMSRTPFYNFQAQG